MNYYTYAYLREDGAPYYIGKGKGVRAYVKRYGNGRARRPKNLNNIIILKQNITEEEAFKHEKYMIAIFGRKDIGTGILHNRTDGGEGTSGRILTEEHKRKLSESLIGIKRDDETKEKLSNLKSGKNHHFYGKTLSEKHKRNLSESHKGKTYSEETKRKISEAHKGKILSEETRRKLSEAHKGKTYSEETRRKLSISISGIKRSEETKIKMSEAKKNPSKETRKKRSEAMKGKRWWHNPATNKNCMSIESPGSDWVLGRSKTP
jgi:hypothetical protein